MCYQCSDYEFEPCPDKFPGCSGSCYGFDCLACSVNTLHIDEYYMLTDEVWHAANPNGRGMMCIGCVEARLGRELTASDFTDAPVNDGVVGQSARLAARLRNK
jgi:hypothetical protein